MTIHSYDNSKVSLSHSEYDVSTDHYVVKMCVNSKQDEHKQVYSRCATLVCMYCVVCNRKPSTYSVTRQITFDIEMIVQYLHVMLR